MFSPSLANRALFPFPREFLHFDGGRRKQKPGCSLPGSFIVRPWGKNLPCLAPAPLISRRTQPLTFPSALARRDQSSFLCSALDLRLLQAQRNQEALKQQKLSKKPTGNSSNLLQRSVLCLLARATISYAANVTSRHLTAFCPSSTIHGSLEAAPGSPGKCRQRCP